MLFYWNSCKIIIMKVIKHLVSIFLQLLTTLKGVHNIFVTGLEFLPDSPLVNDQLHNEFALLSISADNACKVTTLKRRSKLVLLHNSTSTVFYSEKFLPKIDIRIYCEPKFCDLKCFMCALSVPSALFHTIFLIYTNIKTTTATMRILFVVIKLSHILAT